MAEKATLIVEAQTASLVTAKNRLNALNVPAKNVESRIGRMTSAFRVQKGAIQQASFQIQDFAVQVGAGTSAVTAFSQQAPQLLSVLGPGGALLGGVVAVTAAIGGPFLMSLFDSTSASEELEEALDKLKDTVKLTKDGTILLTEEFSTLAGKSREVAEVQLRARLVTAAAATNSAFDQLKGTVSDFDIELAKTGRSVRGNATRINRLAKEYGITTKQVKELKSLQDNLFESESLEDAEKFSSALTSIVLSGANVSDKFVTMVDQSNSLTAELRETKEITDLLNTAISDLDSTLADSSVKGLKDKEEAVKERKKLLKEEEKLAREIATIEQRLTKQLFEEERKRLEEQKRAAQISMAQDQMVLTSKMNFVGQLGTVLQQGAAEGSIAAKAGYATVQAVQIAQTLNSANVAATGQLAAYAGIPDPTGTLLAAAQARAATIRGIGYATAGLIAGQTIGNIAGGRALGGQVRPGEAYRVGEYGPETLVMGSNGGTIVPNGGASNDDKINVVTNVKIIGGDSNATVSTETKQVDRKYIADVVVDLMGNQSSGARQALHRTSNVTPRGNR